MRIMSIGLALVVAPLALAQDTKPAAAGDKPAAEKPAAEPARADDGLHPKIKMETSLGDIVLELDGEKAPITVENFVKYADAKFYDGTIFHRVIADFMIQGGGFLPSIDEKKDGLRPPIKNEWRNGLKNKRGTIAMARTQAADSATAQFFINVVDNARLDEVGGGGAAYCVFGKVVDGMDVVEKIRNTPVAQHAKYPSQQPCVPTTAVEIKSVRVIDGLNKEKLAAQAAKSDELMKKAADEAAAKAKADRESQLAATIKKIEEETGKKLEKTASGLMYVVLKEGSGGESPTPTSTVSVHYTGWLTSGKEFDSSLKRGQPIEFPLNGVIKGWTEGVGMMKVGEKRKLVIPPELGYGKRGAPGAIPPDSWLIFDVELLAIK